VCTEQSIHVLTEAGAPVASAPRAFDLASWRVSVVRLESPQRYVIRYQPSSCLEPEEVASTPLHLIAYDTAGRELSRRNLPQLSNTPPSSGVALFGLTTPPAELATLAVALTHLRSQARASNGRDTWIHQMLLEEWTGHFLPGIAQGTGRQRHLLPGFVALSLLSAAGCALACFLLARRHAFSRGACIGWALCGLLFGWTGLVLLLVLKDWPARISCPSCRQMRRVDREQCEHCAAPHATPAPDGTEIFERAAAAPAPALAGR
jgi:hypothetical protein